MIAMRKLIIVMMPLFLMTGAVLTAQENLTLIDQYMIKLRNDNKVNNYSDEHESFDGTPYLNKEFLKGVITTNTGSEFPGEYRFDVYANQIEFRRDGQILRLAAPTKISKVVIGDLTLKYYSHKEGKEIRDGYFIVLAEGHFTFLEQKTKILFAKVPAKPYQEATPARFADGKDFIWLKVGDNAAERILKTKDIIRICGEHGALAKQFIDTEKLKFKERADYVRLAEYLNGAVR
jgi:hypothetical protein